MMQTNKRLKSHGRVVCENGASAHWWNAEPGPSGQVSFFRGITRRVFQFYVGELEDLFRAGGVALDDATGKLIVSRGAMSIFAVSSASPMLEIDDFLDHVAPADQSRVKAALTGTSPMEHGAVLLFRLLTPAGNVRWCRGIALGRSDDAGGSCKTRFIIQWMGDIEASRPRSSRRRSASKSPSHGSSQADTNVVRTVAGILRRLSPELADARAGEVSQLVSESCGKMLPVACLPPVCHSRLTFRELKVCAAIATGKTTSEIAADLFVSPETVRTVRKNIRRKLGLKLHKESLYSFLKSA